MIVALAPSLPAELPVWSSAVVVAPALAGAAAASLALRSGSAAAAWRAARSASVVAAVATVAVGALRLASGPQANALVRVDNLTVAMLLLISLVGWVVLRFSSVYLAGDPYEQRYAGRMLATLSAVSLVVVANHLVLLVAAWAAASVALHGLLTFFGDRRAAVAVAHKKFLLARCADACMVGAVVAFGTTFDTLRIDAVVAGAGAASSLPTGARVGIVLVAVAALLKSAQLPFHGWLIQVMEAPTPVSALLHAGVVNLGGFVLLRFAPVVDRAVEARTLLVVVGVSTAVVASLVMTTRVSVKVALAWSTCAQMGFMLLQCGLGVWEMALLHLLAHSVYKAYAFLGAGGTVRHTQRRQLATRPTPPDARSLAVGAAVALAGTAAIGTVWGLLPGVNELSAALWVLLGIVALALVPLTMPLGTPGHGAPMAWAFGVPVSYLALHEVVGRVVPPGAPAPLALLAFTGLGFTVLFVLQAACTVAPGGRVEQRSRPWIYAGFFLDDVFTRVAFAVSPPPAVTPRPAPLPRPVAVPVVAVARAGAQVASSH